VFELGATYLRLRSALMLKDPMPEVDPAIYNIRFAHRLDFKTEDINRIAQDATRLIRRFKADWMTQGRRPAGVCGACMVIAARMSGYLRTCEEVAQVVRVSPNTVRKRLMEFAKTQMASKTVQEWREIPDEQLGEEDDEAEPPIVRENRRKAELAEARARAVAMRVEGADEGEDEGDEDDAQGGSGEEDEDAQPVRKKRRTDKEKALKETGVPTPPAATDDDEQMIGALQAAANDLDAYEAADEGAEDDDDDVGLPEMERVDFIDDLNRARDNPEEVARQNKIESRAYKRSLKMLDAAENPEDLQESEFEDDEDEEEYADDEAAEGGQLGAPVAPKKVEFDDWDDEDKMYKYIGETYFKDEINLFKLTDAEVRARVSQWIAGRDPKQICGELALVEKARKERERFAKRKPETEFPDVDDAELEGYYKLEPNELRMRTRVWLSNNGRWLEEDRGGSTAWCEGMQC
jgi:transcription factor IIIB subunit 2